MRWSKRLSILDNPRSGRPLIYSEEIRLKLIAFYCQTHPLPGNNRWSLRWAEKYLLYNQNAIGVAISHSTIQRFLKQNQLKPHLTKYFLQITDPNFFPKMYRLLPLYLNPPKHYYCYDECPGIQVIQRLFPNLQTEEMKLRLEESQYTRHGTMDVLAFLHVKSGKIFATCKRDHTTETFISFFEEHLKTLPADEKIVYTMDNLASHVSYKLCMIVAKYSKITCPPETHLNTMQKRREWLELESKRIVFYFTPFHGSWLNMVEIWFGILNYKCLRESYNSVEAIFDSFFAFLDEWNNYLAHPFNWNYEGKGLEQKTVLRFINILENNIEDMTVQVLTKQLLLMANLYRDYYDKINSSIWGKLSSAIVSNFRKFYTIIDRPENGLIVKNKAKKALDEIITTFYLQIDNNTCIE